MSRLRGALSLPEATHILPNASAADALSTVTPHIVARKRVTSTAFGLASVRESLSACMVPGSAVLLHRHCTQMARVDASAVTAEMVNLVASGDFANEQAISGTMGSRTLRGRPAEHAVPTRSSAALPFPTAIRCAGLGRPLPSEASRNVTRTTHAVIIAYGDGKGHSN